MEIKAGKSTSANSGAKEPKSAEKSRKSKPRSKPTHPPVAKMVNKSIEALNERGGSSVKAIKKYVAANFVVDPEKVTPFIKKYLTKAVENKILLQTKGKGCTGSFKLAANTPKKKETVKRHVTASGTTKEQVKPTTTKKTARKSSSKVKKPASKQQSRASSRKSVEPKASKTSTVSAEKIKA